jgi:hypothetical protein
MAQKKQLSQPGSPITDENICFTIMPFGGWFDGYYNHIYKPAIEKSGFKPKRADDLSRPGTIINDIWQYTQNAKIILADLTGRNPNVFYELGLAHSLAKPAVLIAESIEDVPFDLRALRVIEYNKNAHDWGTVLGEKITTSITELSKSPLQSVLPAFLSVDRDAKTAKVTPHDKELIEIRQELGLLRREVRNNSRERTREFSTASEARDYLISRLARGMSEKVVVERMVDLGAPLDWVEREIDRFKNGQNTPVDSVVDSSASN